MKKFIIKLLVFGLIFFVFDKLFFVVANHSAEIQIDKRLELLINGEINKDIIVLGSSRGARSIIASQIENKTGMSAYNLSYLGSNIEFHEFILKTLLKYNKSPKTILLAIDDYAEFLKNKSIVFRFDRLYPLVKYQYIRDELVDRGEKNKYLSEFFILSQLSENSFTLEKDKLTPLNTIMDCGSMPISFQTEGIDLKFKDKRKDYPIKTEESKKITALKNIVKICNQKKIKLVLFFPPNFYSHNKFFEERVKKIAGDKVKYFFYNTANPIYHNENLYQDESHLIRKGAEIFTSEIVVFLENKMNINSKQALVVANISRN